MSALELTQVWLDTKTGREVYITTYHMSHFPRHDSKYSHLSIIVDKEMRDKSELTSQVDTLGVDVDKLLDEAAIDRADDAWIAATTAKLATVGIQLEPSNAPLAHLQAIGFVSNEPTNPADPPALEEGTSK